MTTIVGNSEKLVSDSRVTTVSFNNDVKVYLAPKLYEKNGAIIGACGTNDAIEAFVKWYGSKKARPKFKIGEFEGLVLTAEGLYYFDETCARDRVLNPWFSVGSGSHAALGALHMGASLEEAVRVACKVDPASGEPIQVLTLKKPDETNT